MNETLAANSNIALYFAMAVFTIAMVSYAVDLAGFAPRARPSPRSPSEARELVAAGGPGTAGTTPAAGRSTAPPGTDGGAAARRRPAAGIAHRPDLARHPRARVLGA